MFMESNKRNEEHGKAIATSKSPWERHVFLLISNTDFTQS